MVEPLFLEPKFHDKIWGGDRLKQFFDFKIQGHSVGEAWIISAHEGGLSIIKNGKFANKTLLEVWNEHKELFGNKGTARFPLLVKFLDAKQDLSVQVHPNNKYASLYTDDLGKTECWYILDATPNAKIYYGHNATSKKELKELIDSEKWNDLLNVVDVHAGDFYYVPAGTVHALGAGVLALEIQQSSDTTYRLYDFDRIDKTTGKKRQLNIEDALNVIDVPFKSKKPNVEIIKEKNCIKTKLIDEKYFDVIKLEIKNDGINFNQNENEYSLNVVINGSGTLFVNEVNYSLNKGMAFIMPGNVNQWEIKGEVTLVVSYAK